MEVLIGKSPINGPFSIAMFDYLRVYAEVMNDKQYYGNQFGYPNLWKPEYSILLYRLIITFTIT